MSTLLFVTYLPPNLQEMDYKSTFSDFRGFKMSRIMRNKQKQILYGILEFESFESADYAKKIMQKYQYKKSDQGIHIGYQEPQIINQQPPQQPQSQPQQIIFSGQEFDGVQQQQKQQQQQLKPNIDLKFKSQLQRMNPITTVVPLQNYQTYQDPNYVVQNVVQERIVQPVPQYQPQQTIQPSQQIQPQFQTQQQQQYQPQQQQQQQQYMVQNSYGQQVEKQGSQLDSFAKNLSSLLQNMKGKSDHNQQNPLSIFDIPPDSTSSLYVDGVPFDSNEREVCHIFRPYPGFKAVRLIRKEAKNGRQFYFCFVDFESKLTATIAMETLQGYRFDKLDRKGLKILYADRPSNKRGDKRGGYRDNRDSRDNRRSYNRNRR